LVAASGAGAITGALLYAGLSHNQHKASLVLWVQIIFSVLLATFALSRNLALSYLALFLTGVCLMALLAAVTSLVQLGTTEEMRGRTMSIFMLAFRGGMPLGNLTVGFLADRFSPTAALVGASVLLCAVALGFLFSNAGMKRL
jgi:MFS family permease